MGFTDNQLKAIESRGRDILVSAAAGSGKTTVLVERIIRSIMSEDSPVDIDRMLVLTFTKAAAGQMKDKILEAIEKKIAEDPSNAHLVKQSLLIQNAQISTFHGFCQEIIRNHFYEIDADPQLRVADEGEVKLMQADAVKKVLEEAYEEASEEFINVAESYTSSKNDSALEDMILGIYTLSQAQPEPEEWLKLCEKSYDAGTSEELKGLKWFKEYESELKNIAIDATSIISRAISLTDLDGGPLKYRPMLEDDLNYAQSVANARDYDEIALLCKVHEKMTLGKIGKNDEVDDELKEKAKKLRGDFYRIMEKVEKAAARYLDKEAESMMKVAPSAREIIRLVRNFTETFSQLKLDAGVIDFNDMEHLAIRILKASDGATAASYREKFVQIYVDEYQDSNLTQEEIISLISRKTADHGGNVFMVGDVKQSIYRFRMARPDLFLHKYEDFSISDALPESVMQGLRIDLSDNFRSRREVLSSANEIFSCIMNKSIGGIEYDDAASLHYGNTYASGDEKTYRSELILAATPEEMTKAEAEACAIGTRINQLVGTMEVVDDTTKKMRKLRFSDIVILLRSMTGRDSVYRDVLTSMGIQAYVTTGVGYFAAKEIDTLLNLLSVIDNPLQDIPLAAVLRSDICSFSDEDLALIKLAGKDCVYLFDAMRHVSEEGSCDPDAMKTDEGGDKSGRIPLNDDLIRKTAGFLSRLEDYRIKSEYMSVYEILKDVIDGEYGNIAKCSPNGSQAWANLNMLLKKAEDFGKLSYKGLFHFLRYIDQIRKYEVDYGEAGITDESDDNVRIMTIHKSKGLEFPVVFVSGLSKSRNTRDEQAEVITDPDLGLGLNSVDLNLRLKKSTLLRDYMIMRLKKENLAEEIRVLYVALTRAKEKLIMVASEGNYPGKFYEGSKPLSMCDSYIDMISNAYHMKGGLKNTDILEMGDQDFVLTEVGRQIDRKAAISRIDELLRNGKKNKIADGFNDRLSFVYSHEGEFAKYSKMSVSELKKESMTETMPDETMAVEAYVPDFIREAEDAPGAGTFYGTAFHRMAELWDYKISFGREDEVTEEEISGYFDTMLKKGRIDKIQLEAVKTRELLAFLKSPVSRRMAAADAGGMLFREQPFTLGVMPGPMLVQGIIDAYWIEDGKIVILDYKTDRVSTGQQLVDRYHVQLEYYEEALSRLLELPVKERIIYSTRLREAVNF